MRKVSGRAPLPVCFLSAGCPQQFHQTKGQAEQGVTEQAMGLAEMGMNHCCAPKPEGTELGSVPGGGGKASLQAGSTGGCRAKTSPPAVCSQSSLLALLLLPLLRAEGLVLAAAAP